MLKVEDIGKQYYIGKKRTFDLRASMRTGISSMFSKTQQEKFWAVKDVSFEMDRGDAMAIIGRNGSGKSTLLKILSRITEPTKGRFELRGKVSSLLEVGTGFHIELTGRENIYLNGTILGMKRSEVRRKFDQIVEFSGVEDFIESPIKHYSSGMKVRLAFAVAAHLEPEILIIDEVLAVGDSEFQEKCLGKMNEVTQQGRTVLFVSHNMEAVSTLCNKGIVLDHGEVQYQGSTEGAVNHYMHALRTRSEVLKRVFEDEPKYNRARIVEVGFDTEKASPNFNYDESIKIWCNCQLKTAVPDPVVIISLFHGDKKVAAFFSCDLDHQLSEDSLRFELEIPGGILNSGNYHFSMHFQDRIARALDRKPEVLSFNILNKHPRFGSFDLKDPGLINMPKP